MKETPATAAAGAADTPPPWRGRGWRVVGAIVGAILVVAATCTLGITAIWRSEPGSRWLLEHLPGVTAVDVHGAFGSGELRIGSLHADEGRTQLDLTGLHLRGLALRWRPRPGAWLGVSFDSWEAEAVAVRTAPAIKPAKATSAPTSLRSPVALDVARIRIASLKVAGAAPLRNVEATLAIGADGGRLHRLDRLRFDWERVSAAGSATLQTDAPLRIDVALSAHDGPDDGAANAATGAAAALTAIPPMGPVPSARPTPAATMNAAASAVAAPARRLPHWTASASLRGPLDAFEAAAALQGEAIAGRAAPRLQARAQVTPFATLPVSAVLLTTTELDLSALSARAPATRLQGSLHIATTQPAALDVDLHNLAPAALSAGGLPFSELTARLQAPWNGAFIAIPALRLVLADRDGGAGELRGQGRWEDSKAQIQLDLDQVQPARIDAHTGAWRVGGRLSAQFDRLPAPGSLWGAVPAGSATVPASTVPASGSGSGSGSASPSAPPASPTQPAPFDSWNAHITARLAGTAPPLASAKEAVTPPAMSLQVDGLLRAGSVQLKQFELRAGAATLSAQGAADQGQGGAWQGEAKVQWSQLDPAAWWRFADAGAARDDRNQLNGTLTLRLANAPASWQGLAAIRGQASMTLADSQLAGLPLQGHASLDATSASWTLAAELHSGANQAHLDGVLTPGRADADTLASIARLHLNVDAPAIATLAPTAGLAGLTGMTAGAGADWPTRGSARLDVDVSDARIGGNEPPSRRNASAPPMKIVTEGELSDWAGSSLKLARLQWKGELSSDPGAPLAATISLVDAERGVVRIARADASLSGTLADHHLQLQGEAPVSPPLWLAHLANVGKANATRLDLALRGRWQPEAAGAPAWEGQLEQLDLRATNQPRASSASASAPQRGATPTTPTMPPTPTKPTKPAVPGAAPPPTVANPAWIQLQPLALSLSRDAAGAWQTLRVGAGTAQVAGLALNWQPSFWTAPAGPGASAHWAVDATLTPFAVAQLLAHAQPDLGWHGDLEMNARLHAAFDGQWHVDARLARTRGDLSVSDLAQDTGGATQGLGLTTALLQVKAQGLAWQADADIAGTRLGELSGHWTAEAPSPASLPTPDSPLHGDIKVHVADLNVWGGWLPPGWRLGGELRTDLALSGRWGAPRLTGDLTARQLGLRNALEGVYAHDGDVAIRLAGDQAQIEHFRLQGGKGELLLTGSAGLGAVPLAKLQLHADRFQLLGRIDRKLVTSGNASIEIGDGMLRIAGKLGIDEGLFDLSKGNAPTLDSDIEVLDGSTARAGSPDSDDSPAPVAPKTGRATTIDLTVDLGSKLQLRGRGIDTTLKGALQLSAPNGLLAVRGNIRTEGGQYVAYGQKLQVTRGELFFTGPVNDPRLDILATRPNLDIVVGVAITGTALAPHVQLTSDPEMSDADKLSWLMLGREPSTLGGADTALLQQAAIALIAGEDEAPTDQLLKRLGLTDFAVAQKTDVNDVRQTVVSLGRQISKRVYVGYERGVNATTGNWQLIYRIAQRFTIRAQSGADNSADVIYTWRWN